MTGTIEIHAAKWKLYSILFLSIAIPAVIAYNSYADKVVRLEYRYDGFTEEFSSILQRHARARKGG